ncbi:MAG TPA: ABC transporter permease, partial [Bacteroidales bacterium]|nr:ABC transporter permease [Bacteroidales bacterium]
MKRFIGFVLKEFRHILRDRRTMLILFGLPVAQLIIFGYVVTNELRDISVAVVDLSRDEATAAITDKVFSSGYFILDAWYPATVDVEALFRQGDIKQVIVFGEDFAGRLQRGETADVQLLADASDANTANLVVNYTSGIIYSYLESRGAQGSMPTALVPLSHMEFNPSLMGVFMFVPGTMALILMLVSAMMTSISIAREKELGTMETLLASPLKPLQIIL